MERFPYKRVAVIGCPGGGKSTFSRALRDRTGLPLYHLDAIYWKDDHTTIPKEEFRAIQRELIGRNEWIIDGNYGSTVAWRIEACDIVFFLDYPTEVCLAGVRARRGQARSDMPWVEEGDDQEFLDFIRAFETESKPKILQLLAMHPEKAVVTFQAREEAAEFLASLEES